VQLMRTTQMLVWSGVVLVAVAGLVLSEDKSPPRTPAKANSLPEAQTTTPKASVKAAADFPVVGYIERRDRTIIVKAGPKGPVYSVKTADGKVLCENLSKEQLSAKAPELGEFLKTAVAGTGGAKSDARVRVKVDASMR
jgi:hypothetical protein